MLLVLLNPYLNLLSAQEEGGIRSCGNTEESPSEPDFINDCFVVNDVQNNCTKIWVKINIHFFVEDDCSGTINPTRPDLDTNTIRTAYQKADDLITWFNYKLEINHQQWNQISLWGIDTVQPAQCFPIRYALSGVYVHCNSTARNTSGTHVEYFRDNFGVNVSSEFNAFFVEWIGNSGGEADAVPGKAFTAEDFSSGVFNHEFGHCAGLNHAFLLDDGCNDTPPIYFPVDFNCNGTYTDNFSPGLGKESTLRSCFRHIVEVTPMDYDSNGIIDYANVCNPPPGCLPEPCCLSIYQNNNVMAYSGYTGSDGAFTACQINRMLNILSGTNYCPYIEQVGGECAPPMANIHVFPDESVSEDCSYCFQLAASMNEDEYKVEILTTSNTLIYNHGWKAGQAWQFCISKSPKYSTSYMHGLQPNTNYKLRLTLKNACDTETIEEYTFRLPELPLGGCEVAPAPYEITNVYPNPFTTSLTVEYDAEVTGSMDIYLFPSGSGSDILLSSEYISTPGSYQEIMNTSSVPTGTYFLVLSLDGAIVFTTAIKI